MKSILDYVDSLLIPSVNPTKILGNKEMIAKIKEEQTKYYADHDEIPPFEDSYRGLMLVVDETEPFVKLC